MALGVPETVAEYLTAEEAKDADALASCFTDHIFRLSSDEIASLEIRS